MRPAPVISVIVPHLDAPEGLTRLMASLDGQVAAPPFEIIVADNGSRTPPPRSIAGRPDVRVVCERVPGPGPARSAGARLARGRILAFTDADCIPRPSWLAEIAAHFRSEDAADAMAGDVRIGFADPSRPTAIEAYEAVYGYRQALYVARDGYGATCNLAVRGETFAKVGPFGGLSIAEDRDWGRRARQLGVAHGYVPAAVVATPARGSFAELKRKWDRHIAHDWVEQGTGLGKRARWMLKAVALLVSPVVEVKRIAISDRITGPRARLLAFMTLSRIRFHRSIDMLQLFLGRDASLMYNGWRQQSPAIDSSKRVPNFRYEVRK